MTKFTTLITTEQLAQHLDDPDWIVFDCRFTLTDTEAGRRAYELGHIPGARYAHLDEDLCSPLTPTSGRHPLPASDIFTQKLGNWGVDGGKQVVVYDDSFGSMAVRLWWMLRCWMGHDAVALLDGGLPRWKRDKYPLSAEAPTLRPTLFPGAPNRNAWVDAAEVEIARNDSRLKIFDARPEERFTGERETLDKIAGHIPGTYNWSFEENLDLGGTLLPAEELRTTWLGLLDDVPPAQIIHVCGSGVTACHNILAMEAAGLSGSKLYPGSWSEWITDPANPVETGENGLICA